MLCDIETDSGCDLEVLALGRCSLLQVRVVGTVIVCLSHTVVAGCLGFLGGLALGILRPQGIGGQVGFIVCAAGAALVLVERIVDLVLSSCCLLIIVLILVLILTGLSEVFSGKQPVGCILGLLCSACELVEIPVKVCSHRCCESFRIIAVECLRAEVRAAGSIHDTVECSCYCGICDVHCYGCADCSGFACCEGAGFRYSLSLLICRQVEAYQCALRIFRID